MCTCSRLSPTILRMVLGMKRNQKMREQIFYLIFYLTLFDCVYAFVMCDVLLCDVMCCDVMCCDVICDGDILCCDMYAHMKPPITYIPSIHTHTHNPTHPTHRPRKRHPHIPSLTHSFTSQPYPIPYSNLTQPTVVSSEAVVSLTHSSQPTPPHSLIPLTVPPISDLGIAGSLGIGRVRAREC